jgi:hypothetical protein
MGGRVLLKMYSQSIPELVETLYPEREWLPWKFRAKPEGFWDDMEIQKKFLDWFASENQFVDHQDWYQISYKVEIFVLGFFESFSRIL